MRGNNLKHLHHELFLPRLPTPSEVLSAWRTLGSMAYINLRLRDDKGLRYTQHIDSGHVCYGVMAHLAELNEWRVVRQLCDKLGLRIDNLFT